MQTPPRSGASKTAGPRRHHRALFGEDLVRQPDHSGQATEIRWLQPDADAVPRG
jgi:hypothetical protein